MRILDEIRTERQRLLVVVELLLLVGRWVHSPIGRKGRSAACRGAELLLVVEVVLVIAHRLFLQIMGLVGGRVAAVISVLFLTALLLHVVRVVWVVVVGLAATASSR